MRNRLQIVLILALSGCSLAQDGVSAAVSTSLPSAPMAQTPSQPAGASALPQTPAQAAPSTPKFLTVKDAQALALKNNPQISVARLTALASQQVTREVRSTLWPTARIDLTAVDANPGTRLTAGALNNPTLYQRAAAGAMVSQLITDFGRSSNLVASANLAAKAENQNALATKEQILLAVDQAFYNMLQAQDVLTVAQRTVQESSNCFRSGRSTFQKQAEVRA